MTPKFTPLISSLPLVHQGKVRDIYQINDSHLLMVATDRISAYDLVFPTPIQQKGKIITSISNFWFNQTKDIIKNHLVSEVNYETLLSDLELKEVKEQAIVIKKCVPLPYEFIVRRYLLGSAFDQYSI